MEYVYAALLLHSSGKNVSDEGIAKILEAAGITPDEVRIKALVAALEGVNISDVLSKATSMPMAVAAAPAAAAGATGSAPAAAAPVEAEEDKEEAEESGIEGLGALFG